MHQKILRYLKEIKPHRSKSTPLVAPPHMYLILNTSNPVFFINRMKILKKSKSYNIYLKYGLLSFNYVIQKNESFFYFSQF